MSLELKLQENSSKSTNHLDDLNNKFQFPADGDLQGFVCFTWTSPFHKYVDYCNLISKSEGHHFHYAIGARVVHLWNGSVITILP